MHFESSIKCDFYSSGNTESQLWVFQEKFLPPMTILHRETLIFPGIIGTREKRFIGASLEIYSDSVYVSTHAST